APELFIDRIEPKRRKPVLLHCFHIQRLSKAKKELKTDSWLFCYNYLTDIFALETFCPAQVSISVPSTVKCSSESRPRGRACTSTAVKKASATSPYTNRSRFLVNTVTSHTGSSIVSPTHQREQEIVI